MNFTDLRIIKTRERLQNALLELLESRELKAITVKEICEKAGMLSISITVIKKICMTRWLPRLQKGSGIR